MFLLVLLADIAGAQAPVAPGLDASGGSILSAAAPVGIMPAPSVVRRSTGSGQVRSPFRNAVVSRGLARELGYRASLKMGGARSVGSVRNLFDGSSLGLAVCYAALRGAETETAFAVPLEVDAPAIAVVEHTGSPAP